MQSWCIFSRFIWFMQLETKCFGNLSKWCVLFFLYFAVEFNEITRQNARIYFNCIERCIHARPDKDLTTYFSIFLFDICILILAQNSGQTFHFYWFIYTDMNWFLVEYSKNFLHLFNSRKHFFVKMFRHQEHWLNSIDWEKANEFYGHRSSIALMHKVYWF